MDTGTTVLRQPRLETTAYREEPLLGEVVQIKRQEGGTLVLENVVLESPYQSIAGDLVILGLASYVFFTTQNTIMKVISIGAGMLGIFGLVTKISQLAKEPTTAYQAVKPSFEV